jgi:hypothetical protein
MLLVILIGVVGGAVGSLVVSLICYRRDMYEMLVCQYITLDEWDEACCDLDYANELIELYYVVP